MWDKKIFPFIIQKRPQIASYLSRVSVIREGGALRKGNVCYVHKRRSNVWVQTNIHHHTGTHTHKHVWAKHALLNPINPLLCSDPLNVSLPLSCNTRPSRHFISTRARARAHTHTRIHTHLSATFPQLQPSHNPANAPPIIQSANHCSSCKGLCHMTTRTPLARGSLAVSAVIWH